MQEVVHNVADRFLQAFLELLEIFFIEENLVFVVGKGPIPLQPAFALRDGEIEVVVSLGGLDIEEIGALACTDGFGIYILRISLLSAGTLIFFTVHTLFVFCFVITKIGILFKKH